MQPYKIITAIAKTKYAKKVATFKQAKITAIKKSIINSFKKKNSNKTATYSSTTNNIKPTISYPLFNLRA